MPASSILYSLEVLGNFNGHISPYQCQAMPPPVMAPVYMRAKSKENSNFLNR
jgi:hypothetical protein